ncbi:hypothetical protein KR222_002447 [Zaprionus bogoriensis]|nr:hypothetical protein KR222_002447 [Zaprionus bogoriensis]
MSTKQQQLDYIERQLVYDIFKYFPRDSALVAHRVECSTGLDGFMSAIYTVELDLKVAGSDRRELVLVKFMKGSPEFRESSKSYTQFANEVFLYAEILPAYEQLLRASKLETCVVDEFVPRSYCARFGRVEGEYEQCTLSVSLILVLLHPLGLGEERESVLALQHLKPAGYALGPRLELRLDQLEAMCNVLGAFHALGHATRILQPQVHERLRAGIVELPFIFAPGQSNLYAAFYRAAFDRFYQFYDRQRDELSPDKGFADALERLRARYFEDPLQLLENIRSTAQDSPFATILHGDFNRNNVLFHENEAGQVDNIKMIDFQELRYGSIAIDLSFFLYMNTPAAERAEFFPRLLRRYHARMHEMLELVLQRNHEQLEEAQLQQLLEQYSYARFEEHFKRYAFYGCMICMHFMPWLLGNEQDCAKLSKLFEEDMHSAAFHEMSLQIAGDEGSLQIFNVVRHAYEQGYMDWI